MEKTNLSGRSLEKELFINATPERVFQALTEKAEASSSSWRPARANLLAVKAHVSQVLRAETAKLAEILALPFPLLFFVRIVHDQANDPVFTSPARS